MLGECRVPGVRIFEIMRELGKVGIEALIEQFADDADQHGIVETSRDRDMKGTIVDHRRLAGMLHRRHRRERRVDALDIGRRRHPRRLFGNRTFDELARPQEFERPFDHG